MEKLVLIVQPVRLQGLIWQAVLKSQQISVIWESPNTDLAENLDQLKAAGLVLPDLLLLDMQNPKLNPYAFCRWCREQYPGTRVVLTNSKQSEVSLSERQWAVNQGASDLLPGFQQENLVSGVTNAVKRILEILDDAPLNNGALISVILAMKRQLTERMHEITRHVSKPTSASPATTLQPALATTSVSLSGAAVTHGQTNGKGRINRLAVSDTSSQGGRSPQSLTPDPSSQAIVPLTPVKPETPTPKPSDSESPDSDQTSRPPRRYRGLYY